MLSLCSAILFLQQIFVFIYTIVPQGECEPPRSKEANVVTRRWGLDLHNNPCIFIKYNSIFTKWKADRRRRILSKQLWDVLLVQLSFSFRKIPKIGKILFFKSPYKWTWNVNSFFIKIGLDHRQSAKQVFFKKNLELRFYLSFTFWRRQTNYLLCFLEKAVTY